jgi:ribosome-associated toxin RatA of RatAB toxin-antitoxin module
MGMVISEIEIIAPIKEVFELAQKVEDFPKFMPDLQKVEVLERRPDGYCRSYWEAIASVQNIKKVIHWEEEEKWNHDDFTASFSQTKGDYKSYGGLWELTTDAGVTKVKLTVDYDLGLPLIGPLINKLLDKLMKENCDSMLKALKEQAEKGDA